MAFWVTETDPVELRDGASEEDLQAVISAVYKQVLGNQHVLESDRLISAESMLRNGDITVRNFVGMVAKSSLYQSLFFQSAPPYRFVEMNFKHLLGRAPISQAELSAHVQTYNGEGYEAEIDSYLCSDEYVSKFGDNVVPYPANISSRVGFPNSSYGRSFELFRGDASCDRDMPTKLLATVAGNLPSAIKAPAVGRGGSYDNTNKRYRIAVSTSAAPATLNKYSNLEYVVNYSQLNQQVRNIHKTGGKIVSITEIV